MQSRIRLFSLLSPHTLDIEHSHTNTHTHYHLSPEPLIIAVIPFSTTQSTMQNSMSHGAYEIVIEEGAFEIIMGEGA